MFCNKCEIVLQYKFFLVSIPQYANGILSYSDFVQSDNISFNEKIKKFDKKQQTELKKLRQTFKKRVS